MFCKIIKKIINNLATNKTQGFFMKKFVLYSLIALVTIFGFISCDISTGNNGDGIIDNSGKVTIIIENDESNTVINGISIIVAYGTVFNDDDKEINDTEANIAPGDSKSYTVSAGPTNIWVYFGEPGYSVPFRETTAGRTYTIKVEGNSEATFTATWIN